MNKINCVLFDLYNTLFKFYPDREETQYQASRLIDLKIDKSQFKDAILKSDSWFAKQTAKKSMHLLNDKEKFLFYCEYEKKLFSHLGQNLSESEAKKIWTYVYSQKSSLKKYDDVIPCLKSLKENNFSVGIITNIDAKGEDLIKDLNLSNYIFKIITSYDAGGSKPSPIIFEYALNIFDCRPSECVFIGDQIETDIIGARNSNITPILLDREDHYDSYEECKVINNLNELQFIL
ncbi:MAG: hypothetical protein CL762_03995 [Chloroflexi bacterium]|nr:hypothetical protein [Chloroflexota bacterium]